MLRTVAIWIGVTALGVLNACAQNRTDAPAAAWHLVSDGATAQLAYGQPQSDNVGLLLRCDAGAGRVLVVADSPKRDAELTLTSGRAVQSVKGDVYDDPLTQKPALEAAAASDSVVFERFARTGKLALIGGGVARPMPARGEARDQVKRFFDLCGAERA